MGSVTLVRGTCFIRKNELLQESPGAWTLSYDEDLGVFMVVDPLGNLWTKFAPHQVVGAQASQTGTELKKHWLGLRIRFSSGDEYILSFNIRSPKDAENAKGWIRFAGNKEKAINEAMTLMLTREKVPVSEICSILGKYSLPSSDADGRKLVESNIATKKVEGLLEGDQFVNKFGLAKEQVRYDIVAKFEVGESGVLVMKCPSCGASLPVKGKESTGTCVHCSTSYAIPRKALDLI